MFAGYMRILEQEMPFFGFFSRTVEISCAVGLGMDEFVICMSQDLGPSLDISFRSSLGCWSLRHICIL